MIYTIKEHGDPLEKTALVFIQEKIPYYEDVWRIFIGNKGNSTIANIPNYPYQDNRINFTENSYTALESSFILHQLIKSGIFSKKLETFNEYMEFNKSLLSFFANLGRMRDTLLKAAEAIGCKNENFRNSIQEFYNARSIVLHGKKIPLHFDELGLIKIPIIGTWKDTQSNWEESKQMDSKHVEDMLTDFFNEIMKLVNNIYAEFKNIICKILKKTDAKIIFEYNENNCTSQNGFIVQPSGTTMHISSCFNVNEANFFLKKDLK